MGIKLKVKKFATYSKRGELGFAIKQTVKFFRFRIFFLGTQKIKMRCLILSAKYNRNRAQLSAINRTLSLVIVTHGKNPFLIETLKSVANQIFPPHQIIVICSTDEATYLEILYTLNQLGIASVVIHTEDGDAAANRNAALEYISGDFVVFLDGDDLLAPSAIMLFLSNAKMSNAVGASCANFPNHSVYHILPPINEQDLHDYNRLNITACIPASQLIALKGFRSSALVEEHLPEDWDFWRRYTRDYKMILGISTPLYFYRQHHLSTSAQFNSIDGKHQFWKWVVGRSDTNYWIFRKTIVRRFDYARSKIPQSKVEVVLIDYPSEQQLQEIASTSHLRASRTLLICLKLNLEDYTILKYLQECNIGIVEIERSFISFTSFGHFTRLLYQLNLSPSSISFGANRRLSKLFFNVGLNKHE